MSLMVDGAVNSLLCYGQMANLGLPDDITTEYMGGSHWVIAAWKKDNTRTAMRCDGADDAAKIVDAVKAKKA